MRLISISVILVLLFFSCGKKESKTLSLSDLEERVDSLIETHIDSARIAGVAIAVYRGDEKLLLKSYGYADLEYDVKLPVNASFEIGSVTKQFTAAAILQLAEQRKLSLDDEITKYINFDTHGKKVTIRHLLSHTSGITGYTELPEFGVLAIQKLPRDTLLRIVGSKPFDFEPGDLLIYNNTGFFMLGLIIEKVSGLTFEEFITKNLFEKAGMTNSYYCSENRVIKNRAHGYDTDKDGLVRAAYLDHTWPYSAGSLCSTVEDLVKWNNVLHHGKILSDNMYQEFISPVWLNNGTITHYAKGITITERNGKRMFEHAGGINGFLSENRYFPDEDISIVVLINSTGPVSPTMIADFIADILFGSPSKEFHMFKVDLSIFPGTYKGPGRGEELTVVVTENDTTVSVQFGDNKPTTLDYQKDYIWTNGYSIYQFVGIEDSINELRIDNIYGYLVLKKEK